MDYILRGRAVYLKGPTRDNYEQAIIFFERALALDPLSIEAQGWLATELAGRVLDGLTDRPEADLARASDLIVQALTEAPRSALAHFAKGQVLRAQRQAAEALAEYETVIALNRNHVNALAAISWCRVYLGSLDAAISALEQVIHLSPRDPQIGVWFARIGLVHLLQSRIDEAILWLERARNANPELPYVRCHLASAYALHHDIEAASVQLAEARKLRGGGSYASIAQIRATGYFGMPIVMALYEATFFAGLRLAGMQDE
jgi:tetratricopeptide (TPR) repeat protein